MEMAADPAVKAIIISQAVPGVANAVERVKETRPDILFILGSAQADLDTIVTLGAIIISIDDLGRGGQIAEHAKEMGAETIVHYSFPRHMEMEVMAERRDLMQKKAEELGIQFVEELAPDPLEHDGVAATQDFITKDVPQKIAQHGPNTAVFGTNCSMMKPMIEQSIMHGGIFLVQCCPGPYHGLLDALNLDIPDHKKGDVPWVLNEINHQVTEEGADGRIATWPLPMNMMHIQAGTNYAVDWIEGKIKSRNDKAALIAIMQDIAGVPVQLTEQPGTDNHYLYLSDHFTLGGSD